MLSAQLRSPVIILIITALNYSTAQAQVEPSSWTPARGILTERLSPKQLELWRKIERIVSDVDVERQILHPVLHALWERVEKSGHTIYLEIRENALSNTAGLCQLEEFDPTGQHHIAVVELNPRVIVRAYVGPDVRHKTRIEGEDRCIALRINPTTFQTIFFEGGIYEVQANSKGNIHMVGGLRFSRTDRDRANLSCPNCRRGRELEREPNRA